MLLCTLAQIGCHVCAIIHVMYTTSSISIPISICHNQKINVVYLQLYTCTVKTTPFTCVLRTYIFEVSNINPSAVRLRRARKSQAAVSPAKRWAFWLLSLYCHWWGYTKTTRKTYIPRRYLLPLLWIVTWLRLLRPRRLRLLDCTELAPWNLLITMLVWNKILIQISHSPFAILISLNIASSLWAFLWIIHGHHAVQLHPTKGNDSGKKTTHPLIQLASHHRHTPVTKQRQNNRWCFAERRK